MDEKSTLAATPGDTFPINHDEPSPFIEALLAALFTLRQGDFTVRLPADLSGVDGQLADLFNDIASVSERRAHEAARVSQGVKENEERLRMALDVAHIAAWEWQLATGQMRWSTDPEALFGFPGGSFGSELRIVRAAHQDDTPRIESAIADALQTGSYEAEYRAVRPDGRIVWLKERGRVFSDVDGERMVGITRDVTAERESALERERLLKREREARDEAEQQSRLKDEFLATLSHELRTPMNTILGWLSILESGKPVRDLASILEVIARNAQIQAKLIDDLLDMNRLLSGNAHLELSAVDIAALLQTTLQGLHLAADAKGVIIVATLDPGVGGMLGDPRRLQQVLWNLIHNAIKFTPAHGRVAINVHRADGEIQIAVVDTGRGISANFLPHVFERFRQQDASPTRATFGLGLGLSIAKQLVELHGGTIAAHSEGEGRGATFIVRLPVVPPTTVAEAPVSVLALLRP
jgi:PAS domain S-box-containing protein